MKKIIFLTILIAVSVQIEKVFAQQICGMNVTYTVDSPVCFDDNDGSIELSVSGGSSSYQYLWNNGETTSDLYNLLAGQYSVIITDDTGCDTTVFIQVNQGYLLDIIVGTNPSACGDSTGYAYCNVMNGQPGYFYQWSSGDVGQAVDSLAAGIYMLTVTDANGCSNSETFGINDASGMSLNSTVTNATCAGVFNGAIDLSVTGGSSPYTYYWSNASTNEDLVNIKAGAYMVRVTDANGCIAVHTVNVLANEVDLSIFNIINPTCGNADGSIEVFPSGGATPYFYQWSANAGSVTTALVTNLAAGTYYVTVTDANGCSSTAPFSLSNPNAATIQIASVIPVSCGNSDGAININIASGVPSFIYEWNTGETTQDISNLDQGEYSVDVTDGNGCVSSVAVTVPGVTLPPITLCMSTVNPTNGKVLCIWDRPAMDNISHFNIYRENAIAGQYDFWFARPNDSTTQWTDQSANPQIRGWRYKVTYVDTCGNESPIGTNHKTIHCMTSPSLSGGVNVTWDQYEGFNFPTFYIERYHISTGWITIDSVPSNLYSYYDTTTLTGTLEYAINIESPSLCDPTRAGVNTSRSNIRNQPISASNGMDEKEIKTEMRLYPNPAQNEVYLSFQNLSAGNSQIYIYNVVGDLIISQPINSNSHRIDVKNLSSGMYTVRFTSGKNSLIEKLVINR